MDAVSSVFLLIADAVAPAAGAGGPTRGRDYDRDAR
jgi:hypothetical protein